MENLAIVIDGTGADYIAARLEEAFKTLGKLPDKERRWLYGSGTFWPDILQSREKLFAARFEQVKDGMDLDETRVRSPATSREIDRMHEALDWIRIVPAVCDRKLITAVAIWRISHSQINWKFVRRFCGLHGHHRDTLRRHMDAAHDLIARRLAA